MPNLKFQKNNKYKQTYVYTKSKNNIDNNANSSAATAFNIVVPNQNSKKINSSSSTVDFVKENAHVFAVNKSVIDKINKFDKLQQQKKLSIKNTSNLETKQNDRADTKKMDEKLKNDTTEEKNVDKTKKDFDKEKKDVDKTKKDFDKNKNENVEQTKNEDKNDKFNLKAGEQKEKFKKTDSGSTDEKQINEKTIKKTADDDSSSLSKIEEQTSSESKDDVIKTTDKGEGDQPSMTTSEESVSLEDDNKVNAAGDTAEKKKEKCSSPGPHSHIPQQDYEPDVANPAMIYCIGQEDFQQDIDQINTLKGNRSYAVPVTTQLEAHQAFITCPHCHQPTYTTISFENGVLTVLMCVMFGIFSLFMLFWVPLLLDDCKDVHHRCGCCKEIVGKYKKL